MALRALCIVLCLVAPVVTEATETCQEGDGQCSAGLDADFSRLGPDGASLLQMKGYESMEEDVEDTENTREGGGFNTHLNMTDKAKCKGCACSFLNNAAKCGKELVTSASKCGEVVVSCTYKVIKDVVKCAAKGFTGKKCKVKTCKKKAKKCEVPKSCFKAMPFKDCMDQLAKDKGDYVTKAIDLLKTTKETNPKKLKHLVLKGIPAVSKQLGKELGQLMPDEIYRTFQKDHMSGYLESYLNTAGQIIDAADSIWDGLNSFVTMLSNFLQKVASGPRKLPRNKEGEFCLFKWDFTIFFFTDCG